MYLWLCYFIYCMYYYICKIVLLVGWKGNVNVKGKEDKKNIFNIFFVVLMYLYWNDLGKLCKR